MSLEQFKNRYVGSQNYKLIEIEEYPATPWEKFKRVVKRTFKPSCL